MHSGELVVVGKNKIEIIIKSEHEPKWADMSFRHHHNHSPCDHGHCEEERDELEHKIHKHKRNEYILTITWKVAKSRIIDWRVHY
jgi:hypothetical protein